MSTQRELTAVKTSRPDVLTMIGRKKLNLAEPWSHCGWKRMDPDRWIVRMAQERILTRGPRKGKPTWEGEVKEVFINESEVKAAELAWEKETGKCQNCGGDGQAWAGWHHINGTSYKTCRRCDGTGMAKLNPELIPA